MNLMDGLVQVSFTVIARLSQVAAAHDMSLTQLRMLAILRDRDREPRMAELAAFLGLEKSSVSGLIDRSAKRGVVRREATPDDARAVRVVLTPAGRRLAAEMTGEVAALLAPMTDRLGAADRGRLGALLAGLL